MCLVSLSFIELHKHRCETCNLSLRYQTIIETVSCEWNFICNLYLQTPIYTPKIRDKKALLRTHTDFETKQPSSRHVRPKAIMTCNIVFSSYRYHCFSLFCKYVSVNTGVKLATWFWDLKISLETASCVWNFILSDVFVYANLHTKNKGGKRTKLWRFNFERLI